MAKAFKKGDVVKYKIGRGFGRATIVGPGTEPGAFEISTRSGAITRRQGATLSHYTEEKPKAPKVKREKKEKNTEDAEQSMPSLYAN